MLNRVPLGPTEFFYRTHDPTTVNRQGHDVGTRTQTLLLFGPFLLSHIRPVTSRARDQPGVCRVPFCHLFQHAGAGGDREACHGGSAEEALRPTRCVTPLPLPLLLAIHTYPIARRDEDRDSDPSGRPLVGRGGVSPVVSIQESVRIPVREPSPTLVMQRQRLSRDPGEGPDVR